jgi:hypothetical protein
MWMDDRRTVRFHMTAPSYLDFMERHLERLELGQYPISDAAGGGSISRFATADPLGSDCTTRGIRIRGLDLFFLLVFSVYGLTFSLCVHGFSVGASRPRIQYVTAHICV